MRENVEYRVKVLKRAEQNERLQQYLYEYCGRDIKSWINTFCWTKNPKDLKTPIKPFILYEDYQDELVDEIEKAISQQYDLLIEKSRELGITWTVLYCLLHQFIYKSGSDFKVGNWKEDFVDRLGDIDTHFEKLRFTLQHLPTWMLPNNFDFGKDATYCRLTNKELGNSIIGETANENFGSGGRRKAMFIDEFAKWDDRKADGAWTATADITDCRIVVSTPVGSSNKFAQLASGQFEKIKKITLHWTLHPEKAHQCYYFDGKSNKIWLRNHKNAFEFWKKNRHKQAPGTLKGGIVRSPWYDEECERRKPEDIAQELDIDYLSSGAPFFDLEALLKQVEWQYKYYGKAFDEVPWGVYVRGIIADLDQKYTFREVQDGWLKVFEMPKKDHQYVVGGDTSEGLPKGDESFAVIRDKWTRSVVATFNGLFEPDDFAHKMQLAGKFYNNALLAPENNGHGYTTCNELNKVDSNLYYSYTGENTKKRGFSTTTKTRPIMLDLAEEEVRKQEVEVRDPDIISQMKTFVRAKKTGKPEADGNMLDDGVIAFAITGYVITLNPYHVKQGNKEKIQRAEVYRRQKVKNGGFSFR